ncbi:MFS transporter [Oenococcus sp. UCMA 17063]|nr:MFS transporter [Oenococcus sp. UCMA 17063]
MEKNAPRAFGLQDKVGYMFGDIAGDGCFVLSSTFLLKFYTDIMKLSPAIVGLMMTVVGFVCMFTTIVIGQVVDHSEITKNGKFKPWILRMAAPLCLFNFLMYPSWFANMSTLFKLVWMFGTYLLYLSIFYEFIDVPFGSMASVITGNPDERTALSNWRSIGGTVAVTVVTAIAPLIVYQTKANGNVVLVGRSMTLFALAISVFMFICYMLLYFLTTERVKPKKDKKSDQKFKIKDLFSTIFATRSLMVLALVVIIRELGNTGLQGMASYIYPDYFHSAVAQSIGGFMGTVVSFVVATFITKVANRFGKKEIIALGCYLAAGILAIAYLIHTHNAYLWITFYGIATVGIIIYGAVSWALVPDIVDEVQVRSDRHRAGTVYSVFSLSRSIGQALSASVVGFMLTGVGYTPAKAMAGNAHIVNGIYNITCIVPLVAFLIVGLLLSFLYPLNKKTVHKNSEILKSRNEISENS